MTVEEHVGKITGILSVQADVTSGKVELSGDHFDLEPVREKIENLGYNYKGAVGKLL